MGRRTRLIAGIGILIAFLGWVVAPVPIAWTDASAVAALKQLSNAYAEISEKVMPSVVTIYATKVVTQEMPQHPFMFMFPDLFGNQGMQFNAPEKQQYTINGVGSGVIVDAANGYVITNEHVVGDFDDLKVRLYNGKEYTGKLVGKDSDSDLALVQIEAKGLVDAPLGDSDAIRPGEIVMAFGAPFDLEHTVTQGIISAKGRPGVSDDKFGNLIQTSAAINRGNSGGPLVNLDGQVVGINEAIIGPNGGFSGVGLAVPSNRVRFVYESLAKGGKVVRGYLGVAMYPIDSAAASMYKLDSMDGALVREVTKDSPADKAGLKSQDVIVAVDGHKVKSTMDVVDRIAQTAPGERVNLDVMRNGSSKTMVVKLGERPTDLPLTAGKSPALAQSSTLKQFGIQSVQNLDQDTARQLGIQQGAGVLVTGVQRGSQAEAAGLSSGDVIQEVNHKPVNSLGDLDSMVAQSMKEFGAAWLSVRNRDGESLVRLSK